MWVGGVAGGAAAVCLYAGGVWRLESLEVSEATSEEWWEVKHREHSGGGVLLVLRKVKLSNAPLRKVTGKK